MKDITTITMSQKEHNYLQVCQRILNGIISRSEGARQLTVSYRTILRILKKYTHGEVQALTHSLRNNPSNHQIDPALKAKVISLLPTTYYSG